jgi:hypothetical protein
MQESSNWDREIFIVPEEERCDKDSMKDEAGSDDSAR